MKEDRAIQNLFYRGNVTDVLAQTVDSVSEGRLESFFPWIIGALSFSGRVEEAESYWRNWSDQKSPRRAEARFYLAVGLCRQSKYEKARNLFAANFFQFRRSKDPEAVFFVFQGLAFYRYFFGNMARVRVPCLRALEAALAARFTFGKAFAYELLGHCQIHSGEISQGLATLELAIRSAKLLGNGGLEQSFSISYTSYLAQFGIAPQSTIKKVEHLLSVTPSSYGYSQGILRLELSRQRMLQGNVAEAKKLLNAASPLVHGLGHRRQISLLNLRYSELYYLKGDSAQALHFADMAERTTDPKIDRTLEIQIMGMKRKLLPGSQHEEKLNELQNKTRGLKSSYCHRILERQLNRSSPTSSEDSLGDLIDATYSQRKSAVNQILASGYLGFLYEALSIPRDQQTLYLDRESKSLGIFDHGNVTFKSDVVSPLMASFIQILARQSQVTKEELIRSLWKYREYNPLRHDSVLYRLISRIREMLGPYSKWIRNEEGVYCIDSQVQIVCISSKTEPLKSHSIEEGRNVPFEAELNFRQIGILERLATRRFSDVADCSQAFKVSEATARRDLTDLVRTGHLARLGKGRATKYMANQKQISNKMEPQ